MSHTVSHAQKTVYRCSSTLFCVESYTILFFRNTTRAHARNIHRTGEEKKELNVQEMYYPAAAAAVAAAEAAAEAAAKALTLPRAGE
jgi:hypothetical protein